MDVYMHNTHRYFRNREFVPYLHPVHLHRVPSCLPHAILGQPSLRSEKADFQHQPTFWFARSWITLKTESELLAPPLPQSYYRVQDLFAVLSQLPPHPPAGNWGVWSKLSDNSVHRLLGFCRWGLPLPSFIPLASISLPSEVTNFFIFWFVFPVFLSVKINKFVCFLISSSFLCRR